MLPTEYLHSTMYLLNLTEHHKFSRLIIFTFHYVSIKSTRYQQLSLMYKLFTFHYVSIKSGSTHVVINTTCEFTFHYVSIKSVSLAHPVD